MKSLKISGLLLAATLVVFSACKKKKDDPTPAEVKTASISSGNWKLTATTVSPALNGVTDQYEACHADDITKFNADGSASYNPGTSTCDSTDQAYNFNWFFGNSSQTVIIATVPGQSIALAFDVVEISDNKLVVAHKQNIGGVDYTYTETFTH